MTKYWVYIRVRIPVETKTEREAEALGMKELTKITPTAELRKIGVFKNTTK